MLDDSSGKKRRNRLGSISLSLFEMTTIVVLFHTMRGRQFKTPYQGIVCRFMIAEFPRRPPHTRFVALMPRGAAVLAVLFPRSRTPARASPLPTQRHWPLATIWRIQRHSAFKGIAQRGKSSTRWFYGFKLYAVMNHQGELLAIKPASGKRG